MEEIEKTKEILFTSVESVPEDVEFSRKRGQGDCPIAKDRVLTIALYLQENKEATEYDIARDLNSDLLVVHNDLKFIRAIQTCKPIYRYYAQGIKSYYWSIHPPNETAQLPPTKYGTAYDVYGVGELQSPVAEQEKLPEKIDDRSKENV